MIMPTLVNTREGDKNHQNSFSVESERPHMENKIYNLRIVWPVVNSICEVGAQKHFVHFGAKNVYFHGGGQVDTSLVASIGEIMCMFDEHSNNTHLLCRR